MKEFEELNYYEMLEVTVESSPFEIRQAYKEALSIYGDDSLVTYSLFTDEERGEILARIEEAFYTLIDEKKRIDYDRQLVNHGKIDSSALEKRVQKKPIPLFQAGKSKGRDWIQQRIKRKIQDKGIKDLSSEILSKDEISGGDLSRVRKLLGINLEDLFEVTRVNVSILEAIEADQFETLPPMIYLENFLKSYARVIQIDPEKVCEGYVRHLHRRAKDSGNKMPTTNPN